MKSQLQFISFLALQKHGYGECLKQPSQINE